MKTLIIALLALPTLLCAQGKRATAITLYGEGAYLSQDYSINPQTTGTTSQHNLLGFALIETPVSPDADFLVKFAIGHASNELRALTGTEQINNPKLSGVGFAFGIGVKLYLK